jgi:hypothetical protein
MKREGVHVGRKRVERLMREAEIAGVSPRRKGFTRRDPKAVTGRYMRWVLLSWGGTSCSGSLSWERYF